MISFAGGLPSPESFPIEDVKRISAEVLEKEGTIALQYGTTEGDTKLRQLLAERHNRQGLSVTYRKYNYHYRFAASPGPYWENIYQSG